MTTYNGRSAQYQPGKEVPNKEPPISKFVVEKLYQVHRTRMAKMQPVVDCHVNIPDFLSDQNWKKTAEEQKKLRIERENKDFYNRIAKVEKAESFMTKDYKDHVKRIEIKSTYLKKLKDHGRLVNVMKIQKENEYFLQRIEKARPQYGQKKLKDWYKHHEMFKQGRRSDPCAGHIFKTVSKDLYPKPLPPLNGLAASFAQSSVDGSTSIYSPHYKESPTGERGHSHSAGGSPPGKESDTDARGRRRRRRGKSGSPGAGGAVGNRSLDLDPLGQPSYSSSLAEGSSTMLTVSQSMAGGSYAAQTHSTSDKLPQRGQHGGHQGARGPSEQGQAMLQPQRKPSPPRNLNGSRSGGGGNASRAGLSATAPASTTAVPKADSGQHQHQQEQEQGGTTSVAGVDLASTDGSHVRFTRSTDQGDGEDQHGQGSSSGSGSAAATVAQGPDNRGTIGRHGSAIWGDMGNSRANTADTEATDAGSVNSVDESLAESLNELTLLVSRPFALPFEAKNCLVQVYMSKSYDENLHLKVISSGVSKLLCERALSIDKAHEMVNASGHSSQIVHSSENEDLATLSALLINMFKEADDDGSGSLTFDEFQTLMEKVELGISPQELRFVISEADENENGVVDYEEFVPLAVDLIQSFRARNRAKTINSLKDVEVDDMIMQAISPQELQEITHACLAKIYEVDTKKYGLIRVPELKRCLMTIANTVGLRDSEVNMICQMLPRDQFERVKYNTDPHNFYETLSKVRFTTMKNAMVESQGSGLQKYLLDLCRDEEASIASKERLNFSKETFVHSGRIPFRSLINILSTSSRLSLSRLQVLVIMSEAHVQEGMINYFQFVPVVAKAIEIMFEPKALRQRAELIEKTDLSPEALLQGMSSEMFEQRLLTLFKSYDIDHSGGLDQNEFIACLESLDLQLTYGEMVALMAAADVNHTGILSFEEFVGFFTQNLLNLEREKRLRLLQSSMNKEATTGDKGGSGGGSASGGTAERDDGHGGVTAKEEKEFREQLVGVFKLSDPEGTGLVPLEEFDTVLKTFSITNSHGHFMHDVMMSELHVDENGMVNYSESVSICGELLKVYRARENAMEEHRKREEGAQQKAVEAVDAQLEELHQIVRFLRPKIKAVNDSCSDAFIRYNELMHLFRSPASGLARVEANMLIKSLLNGEGADGHGKAAGGEGAGAEGSGSAGGGGGSSQHDHSSQHGVHSFHMKTMKQAKVFRSVFSQQELFDAVYQARKTTIMRGLLEEVDSTALHSTILDMLNEEAQRLKKEGSIPADSLYLPVEACFRVLESAHAFRLNRSQILFIISWAECFDKVGKALELDRFAEHCSEIISKLNVAEMLDTRSEVLSQGTFDDKVVLNGMREKDVEKHLEYAFSQACDEQGLVDATVLQDVLKGIPRLSLADREIHTIVATFRLTDKVFWKDILHATVSNVISLCRERVIHRRVSIAATTSRRLSTMPTDRARLIQGYAQQQLSTLAERLLNYVKLETEREELVIRLPLDHLKGGRTSQMAPDDGIFFQSSENNILFRAVRFMPWYDVKKVPVSTHKGKKGTLSRVQTAVREKTFREMAAATGAAAGAGAATGPVGTDASAAAASTHTGTATAGAGTATTSAVNAANTPSSSAAAVGTRTGGTISPRRPVESEQQFEIVKKATGSLPVMVSVHAQENSLSETTLVASIVDCRSMIMVSSKLEVKLPTIALVDRDAAGQFASNVVSRLCIEDSIADQTRELKML